MIRDVSYHVNVLRNGAEFARLHWRSGDNPNIMVNKDAEIKGSFSGRFYVPDTVDLLSDELQPVMRLNGVETPLGVFQTAPPFPLYTSPHPRDGLLPRMPSSA